MVSSAKAQESSTLLLSSCMRRRSICVTLTSVSVMRS